MIIGADGQLGTDLVRTLEGDLAPLTHADIEVSDRASVDAAMDAHRPDVVINTAAYHQVDAAEGDPAKAIAVNTVGARNVALACAAQGADLCHVSTDYVFGGDKRTPYDEDDPPGPLNVYGTTKLAGEHFVRVLAPRSYIARTTGLFGIAGSREGRSNFVETMLRLAGLGRDISVVGDQRVSPTYTYDLALALGGLIATRKYGVYHVTNSTECSWFELATAVFALTGLTPNLSETTAAEFGAAALRPAYSVLANGALERVGVPRLRPWRDALAAYLDERGLLA
jgi:dTDP-4-dehydrorhamnose reductase